MSCDALRVLKVGSLRSLGVFGGVVFFRSGDVLVFSAGLSASWGLSLGSAGAEVSVPGKGLTGVIVSSFVVCSDSLFATGVVKVMLRGLVLELCIKTPRLKIKTQPEQTF